MFQNFKRQSAGAAGLLQIGIVTENAPSGAKIRELLSKRDGVAVHLIASSSVTSQAPPPEVSIFVYELNTPDQPSALKEFARFMSERPPHLPVIVLCSAVDEELVRWFLRLRVADWLKTPFNAGELISACGRVLSQQQHVARHDLKCLTFIGARGGVGATTLAIHAALILQGLRGKRSPTCLVDLDFVSGSCADYLDLTPAWQLEELIPDPTRLDDHMMDVMLVSHAVGIRVLAAQPKYGRELSISEEVVTRALDIASQRFANLVIDLPRGAERWTDSVINGSSNVYVVTDLSIPGLKAAVRLAGDIAERSSGITSPQVIVNKFERSLFGSGISRHEAKQILRSSLGGYVRSNNWLVREAIDRGIPTTSIKPKNTIIRDLSAILQS
jgi:pilus assembly protein CpaE